MRRTSVVFLVGLALVAAGMLVASLRVNPYFYFAAYVILQYIVIATAWNILGGYAGYVNFGTPAFFALGAYTAVFLIQSVRPPLPVLILAGGLVSALLGLGIGYLTLRLRGVFFSIATLALSIVLQTVIINWEFVGGSRGLSVIRPSGPPFGNYVTFLFTVMVFLAVVSVITARFIERFLLGVAGAPFPYYVTFVDPNSAFSLDYAVNALAMPMIGGTTSWVGPIIGAVLLGTAQQLATVTISSEMNLFIVGVVLVAFVVLAPEGILGLVRRLRRH
jgi:branched-chain amino acid transport system permease protein